MNRLECIDFIEDRPWQGASLDLTRMVKLMNELHNPQKKLKFIHIAGTNGKGSACAMMTSVLLNAGYKVGTYISPHLINYEERISINNQNITEKEFCEITEKVKKASANLDFIPRVFEILTAIAFVYFGRHKCDIVVLEVGMGGRLDATNVIDESLLSIIMNIGLEHTEILGDTLGKIAGEKAGIIKENGDIVVYDNSKEVIDVIRSVAGQKKANLTISDFDKLEIISEGIKGQKFNYKEYKNVEISLLGKHQFNNAATLLEAFKVLKNKGLKITDRNILEGLRNTKWSARLSILSKEPLFILDGAHNPQCASALKDSLPMLLGKKKAIMLCGMLKDKDYEKVMEMMIPFAKEFICLTPNSSRALESGELENLLKTKGLAACSASSVKEGIELALNKAKPRDVIIAFGSLYLAGDILKNYRDIYNGYLRKKMIKKRNSLTNKKREILSKEIVDKIKKSKEFKEAKNILLYKAINNEVDLSELTKVKGKTFAYPRCDKKKMSALIPFGENDFESGIYGIQEPIKKKSLIMKDIDLVICPLLAFDKTLNRLGYGKGYYDRFLSKNEVKTIGVAYDFQEVEEILTDIYDIKMDRIITNACCIKKDKKNTKIV